MGKPKPYISVVVSGRNDNYGGDFTLRIQNQVSWLGALADQFKLPVEYVLVNYNPITDQPSLRDTLAWPDSDYFSVLQVTVPEDIHRNYVNPEVRKSVPLYEFIAKNAGIRRCSAPFILTTNADILFDPALIEFLAKRCLDPGLLYRTDRLDHRHKEPFAGDVSKYVKDIRGSVFKFFLKGGTYSFEHVTPSFQLLSALHRNLVLPLKRLIRSATDTITKLGLPIEFVKPESLKPCNASGDFLLASCEQYLELRGFPEDTYISTHTDSLMVYKFIFNELKIVELDHPVYHADHERRFKFDTPLGDEDMANMYYRLQREIQEMTEKMEPTLHNDEHWGMAQFDLPVERW